MIKACHEGTEHDAPQRTPRGKMVIVIMSFSEDPWECLPRLRAKGDGEFKRECDSCGGESAVSFYSDSTIQQIRDEWAEHITKSHARPRPHLI